MGQLEKVIEMIRQAILEFRIVIGKSTGAGRVVEVDARQVGARRDGATELMRRYY
ncbi:hypothetical protein GCM10022419_064750 [Nonomuraea rosea]|uniref:Uncharacterized protein n=1 Tax=Nonomuraea rosea TaxID=638574 RepID=A0ABP6XZU7_9ACTN